MGDATAGRGSACAQEVAVGFQRSQLLAESTSAHDDEIRFAKRLEPVKYDEWFSIQAPNGAVTAVNTLAASLDETVRVRLDLEPGLVQPRLRVNEGHASGE